MDEAEMGPRAKALLQAIDMSLKAILTKIRFSRLALNFQVLYNAENVGWLQKAHMKAVTLIEELTQEEVNRIITDEKIVEKLNELDTKAQDKTNKLAGKSWRPTGNPRMDIRPHLTVELQDYNRKLGEKLTSLEEEKVLLMAKVTEGRRKVRSLETEANKQTQLIVGLVPSDTVQPGVQ